MNTARRGPWGRFDDLVTGDTWCFPAIEDDLVATEFDQVREVLQAVDLATARGRWAFGFVAYEAAAALDPALTTHGPVDGLPLAWFGICDPPIRGTQIALAEAGGYGLGDWVHQWREVEHRRRVSQVRERIAAGETYQCNLTTRMAARFRGDPLGLYADLALAQGGQYNAYLDVGRFIIASASPELFFDTEQLRLRMRPMKGTAPRGDTTVEDTANLERLRTSEKDRAENIMIVDLIRNDVARLAVIGGVSVHTLCQPERYPTVYQLTSEVTAQLRRNPPVGLVETFAALFPCGSVTGTPKASTMRLISELEDGPRGVYCGAIGMVGPRDTPFHARFNVAIRTVTIDRRQGTATYGTGGAITWPSDPTAEYAELQAKAALLTRLQTSSPFAR